MKIGDRVRVIGIPDGLPAAGDETGLHTSTVFQWCMGRTFSIVGFNEMGYAELEVGEAAGQKAYMSSIWIEPELLLVVKNSN